MKCKLDLRSARIGCLPGSTGTRLFLPVGQAGHRVRCPFDRPLMKQTWMLYQLVVQRVCLDKRLPHDNPSKCKELLILSHMLQCKDHHRCGYLMLPHGSLSWP
jgi:hypothetical protein